MSLKTLILETGFYRDVAIKPIYVIHPLTYFGLIRFSFLLTFLVFILTHLLVFIRDWNPYLATPVSSRDHPGSENQFFVATKERKVTEYFLI